MAMAPRIAVSNLQTRVRVNRRRVSQIARAVIAGERAGNAAEIGVCFLTDARIRRFNREFHGTDCTTDVLAFDLGAPGECRADIVISADTASANAGIFGTTPLHECYLYLIHGMLHLLGYDDSTPRKRAVMRRRENHYLKQLKIS
jgi:probable rRNA maturation factor